MAGPVYGPNLPPSNPILDLLSSYESLLGDQLTAVQGEHRTAIADKRRALLAYATQATAPTPELDPRREFMARLAGNISQAIAPQMGGQDTAERSVGERRASMIQQHSRRVELMGQHYDELAARAKQLGDIETALKYQTKAESMKTRLEAALALEKIAAQREGDRLQASATVQAANARADANPKLPAILQAVLDPFDKEAAQLQAQVNDLRGRSVSKGANKGRADKMLAQAMRRLATLEEARTSGLAAYQAGDLTKAMSILGNPKDILDVVAEAYINDWNTNKRGDGASLLRAIGNMDQDNAFFTRGGFGRNDLQSRVAQLYRAASAPEAPMSMQEEIAARREQRRAEAARHPLRPENLSQELLILRTLMGLPIGTDPERRASSMQPSHSR